jgi:hypothetical protein
MTSPINLPLAVSPRFASVRDLGAEIGAGLVKFPWGHAAMLSCSSAALGAILWWVWW